MFSFLCLASFHPCEDGEDRKVKTMNRKKNSEIDSFFNLCRNMKL